MIPKYNQVQIVSRTYGRQNNIECDLISDYIQNK